MKYNYNLCERIDGNTKYVLHKNSVCDNIKESMFDCGGAYANQL